MKNTYQDPEYEGPTYHEKRVHPTHFGIVRPLKKRMDGETMKLNGVEYVWKKGKWIIKE